MKKSKISLKLKYSLYVFAISLLISIIAAFATANIFYNISKENFKEEANALFNIFKPEIVSCIENLNYVDIGKKLSEFVKMKNINGIVVLNSSGDVIVKRGERKGFNISKNFEQGKLVVYFSNRYLKVLIKSFIKRLSIIFSFIIPLIGLLTYFLVRIQLKDIKILSNIIKKLGNPESYEFSNILLKRNDEISELTEILKQRHFNLINYTKELNLLHTTVEQCYNSIVITDIDANILYVNSAFTRITGYSLKEVLGKNPRILKSGKQSDEFYKKMWDTILSGKIWEGKLVNKTKHEDFYIEKMIITPVKDNKNDIKNFIAIKQDITKEVEYEKKLLRMEKMETVETMASGIAHEINNILTAVISYPELLLNSMENKEKLKNGLKKIQEAGFRISDILLELTSVSKNIAFPKQEIDIDMIVSEAVTSNEFKQLLKLKPDIRIMKNIEKDIHPIKGSKAHITKSIINLMKNAFESIEEKGTIVIKTENVKVEKKFAEKNDIIPGNYVRLSISDTGKGISGEDLEKIFEPFFTKKKLGRKSTGLGLTIVLNTVKSHGGAVIVDSNEHGTKFDLYFPASESGGVKPKQVKQLKKEYSVLIVDDEKSQREILAEILKNNGFKTYMASSGEEAVEFIKYNDVDIMLLDMIMETGIDGCETFEKIKKIKPLQKAIIISGMSYSERINKALTLGVNDYIKKPYTAQHLIYVIKSILEKTTLG